MKQLIFLFYIAFLFLYSPFSTAGKDNFFCGYQAEQFVLGALPELKSNSEPFIGYRCDLSPHVSSFLGNWLPSLPAISLSQSRRSENDDYNQSWSLTLPIKRIGQGQFYLAAKQTHSQQILTTQEEIPFIPSTANSSLDAVSLSENQQVRLSHKHREWQLGFRFAYQENQPLTELSFQRLTLDQPVQANVDGFSKRSLFQAITQISKLAIASESRHRGLNINWQFAMGIGEVKLEPESQINIEKEQNQLLALTGVLELYYHHRINRRWFAYSRWQGEINYWQQANNEEEFQLAPNDQLNQQFNLGVGLSF